MDRDLRREYMRNYLKKRRQLRRQKFIDLLGGECSNCGSRSNLEFDHKKSKKKEYDLDYIKDGPENRILKELKKCVLLCRKCHLEKTRDYKDFINKDKRPARHGTIWYYKKFRCRCPKCKKAISNYLKDLKNR